MADSTPMTNGDITQILDALQRGEPLATEQLMPLVYEELRRLAGRKMAQEAVDHSLQPTALVDEAYLRLVGDGAHRAWDSRGHFYAAAAEAMRRILIESARRRGSLKRGGEHPRIDLPEDVSVDNHTDVFSLLALDEALSKLETVDPDSFRLVMLRYFGGLTVDESAAALGISPRTAKRHWSYARAWLQREIDGLT